ncbi:MAG: NAD(P)-dependent oxidoreductase [Mycobacterium sp.]|uniref:NAD(P)-dependent oxidoreductase n=1 Tax=Mycobacterium sp. TaxID=1785 RepID=UPI003CC587BC
MTIGFIGAGRMGRPMVARLVEAGHDVRVLGRSAEKRSTAADLGATGVADVAHLSAEADVVVVCVFTDEQVLDVCLGTELLETMIPGSTLVVHTTSSPRTVETIAARAAAVAVVDAPVSGGPHNAAAGALTLFVGGADDAVANVRPVVSCYGDPVLHVGPLGAGQKVKLINNAMFAAHLGLLSEAIGLGTRLDVPESALLAALPHGSASSRVLDLVAAGGSVEAFARMAGEFVGKDVAVARNIVGQLGSHLGALDDLIEKALQV